MLWIFNELLVRPIYNALIVITDFMPGHSLALGIIVLTIFIRLALLGPAGAAIRSQREMQKIQPELDKIKKKYAGNQQKISEETMKLFKQHKVNPFGGCLPLLVQLPILWAFFWVLRTGVGVDASPELYSFVTMPEVINTHFLWVPDITQPDPIWLPVLVAVFQFLQMKTISWRNKSRQKQQGDIAKQQQLAQGMMTYVMPLFIGFIARGFSAGLSIYWITTSIFSTAQQMLIALQDYRKNGANAVKVIDKK